MKSRLIGSGLLGCILIAAISGIGLLSNPSVQAAEKEIVWAVLDDFSGPYASTGEEGFRAFTLFLEENNYKIGLYKIKVVTRDTELKPAVGVRRVQELLSEFKPQAVFSAASSAVQLAMCDIMAKAKGPIFWTDGWDTRLTGSLGNRYTFRWAASSYTMARASVSGFLDKFPDIRTAIHIEVDYAHGYDMAEHVGAILKERGVKRLKTQFIPVTATDASVFVTEARDSGADLYIMGTYGKTFATLLTQVHEFGLQKKMKLLTNAGTLNILRGLGSNVLEGMYLADHWNHAIPNKWSRDFTENFQKRWGVIPGDYAATRYLECQLMERVIKQTGSDDPKVLIPALEKIGEFDGPTGKESMAAWQHQVIHDFLLLRAKSPQEKKYEDDYVEVVGAGRDYPKQGEKGYEFDRTKEPL